MVDLQRIKKFTEWKLNLLHFHQELLTLCPRHDYKTSFLYYNSTKLLPCWSQVRGLKNLPGIRSYCLWLLQARLFDQSYTWTSCVVKRCLLLLLLRTRTRTRTHTHTHTHTRKIKEKDGAFISLCLLIWMSCELNKLQINEESNVRDRDKVYLGMYWTRGSVVAQSCLTLATPWTVACQVPLSIELSRQEYWSGYLCPSLGDLPDPWIKPRSPALQTDTLPSEPAEEPHRTQRACFVMSLNKKNWVNWNSSQVG